jgi:hypothetical protein
MKQLCVALFVVVCAFVAYTAWKQDRKRDAEEKAEARVFAAFDMDSGGPNLRDVRFSEKQPLSLEVLPRRYGADGLLLDIRLWNLGHTAMKAVPVDSDDCVVQFIGPHAEPLNIYGSNEIVCRASRPLHYTRLAPGTYFGGRMLFAKFYRHLHGFPPVRAYVIHLGEPEVSEVAEVPK